MMNGRIEVKSDGHCTKVFVDGEEVRRVRSVRFGHEAGSMPSAVIELIREVDIDEIADIIIDDESKYSECCSVVCKKLSCSMEERQRWLDCISDALSESYGLNLLGTANAVLNSLMRLI